MRAEQIIGADTGRACCGPLARLRQWPRAAQFCRSTESPISPISPIDNIDRLTRVS